MYKSFLILILKIGDRIKDNGILMKQSWNCSESKTAHSRMSTFQMGFSKLMDWSILKNKNSILAAAKSAGPSTQDTSLLCVQRPIVI